MSTLLEQDPQIKHRKELKTICQLAYEKGLVSGFNGNFSLRMNNGNILITPKSSYKGLIQEDDFVEIDLNENLISSPSGLLPSTESSIHVAAYKKRPDINAFIHTHPQKVISLTVCGIDFNEPIIPDSIIQLGEVAFISYPGPDMEEELKLTISALEKRDVVILDKHGAVTVGKNALSAFYKAELLEHTAEVLLDAHIVCGLKIIEPELIEKLIQHRHKIYEKDLKEREGTELFKNVKQTFKIKNIFKKLFENNSPVIQRVLNLVNDIIHIAIQNTKYSERLSSEDKEQLSRELTTSILGIFLGRFTKKTS